VFISLLTLFFMALGGAYTFNQKSLFTANLNVQIALFNNGRIQFPELIIPDANTLGLATTREISDQILNISSKASSKEEAVANVTKTYDHIKKNSNIAFLAEINSIKNKINLHQTNLDQLNEKYGGIAKVAQDAEFIIFINQIERNLLNLNSLLESDYRPIEKRGPIRSSEIKPKRIFSLIFSLFMGLLISIFTAVLFGLYTKKS